MGRRYSLIITAVISALFALSAAYAENPSPSDNTSTPRKAFGFHYGLALTASGSIVGGASDGLSVLEKAINNGYLYAPSITPIIQRTFPIYTIPPFQLGSNEFGFHYERSLSGPWSWTCGLNYMDITAHVDIPATFVDPSRLGIGTPGTFQVTGDHHNRVTLASVIEVQAGLQYEFHPGQFWNPYARGGGGVGRGYLGEDHGATVWEGHLFLAGGLRVQPASTLFIWVEALATGHTARAKSTNPVDRKKVLVNPGTGNIYIGRIAFGTGVRL